MGMCEHVSVCPGVGVGPSISSGTQGLRLDLPAQVDLLFSSYLRENWTRCGQCFLDQLLVPHL